jgi:hypothetical protein
MRPTRFDGGDYAELLGLYLGDGHIAQHARTQRLRISLDTRHRNIVIEAHELLERCFPRSKVGVTFADCDATAVVNVYSQHMACLFPQHGDGKKHDRPIRLEPWQRTEVAAAPWRLLRGLIRSDGCVFINRTGRYEYLSYDFTNRSSDILDLFVVTCDSVGVQYRRYARQVRIYRRASVALMREHVGVKS